MLSLKLNTGVALTALLLFCCGNNLMAQNKIIVHNGNKFEVAESPDDTVIVVDPLTGDEQIVVTKKINEILKMNNTPVVPADKSDEQVTVTMETIVKAIEKKMRKEGKELGQGSYDFFVNNLVIDEYGHIVYHEPSGIQMITVINIDGIPTRPDLAPQQKDVIGRKIDDIVDNIRVSGFKKNSQPVIYSMNIKGNFVIR